MGSIPLPALHVNPPQPPPNAMEQYGQLMQLRNAPIQNQILQQQAQAGQMDVQQKQIQLKDQQAMSAAMQQWGQSKPAPAGGAAQGAPSASSTMPNYDDLVELAKKNGASFNAIKGLQTSILDMRAKAATIAKDDAQTGASNATAMKTKNGMIVDAMTGVMNLPDEQIAPGLLSVAQELAGKGLLDPQHIQMAQQLAQSGNPASIRQQLDVYAKSLGGFSQMLTDAQKKAELVKTQGASDPNSPFYAPSPTAVTLGTAPKAAEIKAGEASQKATVAGAEASARQPYELELARQRAAIANNNAGGSSPAGGGPIDWSKVSQKYGMTQQAFDQQAEKYYSTGQLPQIGRNANAIAMNRDLMNRAADLHPNASLAANSAEFKANSASLKTLQANFDQVSAFEGTANKNIEMLKGLAQKVPDLGARFANVPVRMLSGSMIGSEGMAAFKTALAPVQAESAKILNSANLSGQLSDSSRHELQDIVDGNLPYKSLVASLGVLQQDFKNRHNSIQEAITNIQGRLGGTSTSQPSAPMTITLPSGKKVTID